MAIFAATQPGGPAVALRPWARAARWLSVAAVLLAVPAAAQLAPGMYHIETVNLGGGLYEWRYRFAAASPLPTDGYFEITGLHDVQVSGTTSTTPGWVVAHTPTSLRMVWTGAAPLPPSPESCPEAGTYFYYRSSSGTAASVPWTRSDGTESGSVFGAGEPPDQPSSVAVYDNWIGFGVFSPTAGTASSPARVIADRSPAGAWGPTAGLGVDAYDVGYLQINATRRLNLRVRMGGHLTRCTASGEPFAGKDTRKSAAGNYELATQWKVNLRGRFLTPLPEAAPCPSPTSGAITAYNAWSGWSAGGNDPVSDSGWLWPSATDAWTGEAAGGGYVPVTELNLVVERDQFVGGVYDPAAIAIIERVLRRGEQDVEGNYQQVIDIQLTYAE